MSAVGFNPAAVNELEELRKICGSLNDVSRNLASAQACLGKDDKRALTITSELLSGTWTKQRKKLRR